MATWLLERGLVEYTLWAVIPLLGGLLVAAGLEWTWGKIDAGKLGG